MNDRTVHAWYPGSEIVRYDRSGKWYVESTDGSGERRLITVDHAANLALREADGDDGAIHLGRPGGAAFDRRVNRIRNGETA